MKNIVYVKYSNERSDKFKIRTCIVKDGDRLVVEKAPLTESSREHIANIYNAYLSLSENNLSGAVAINKCTINGEIAQLEYIKGNTLEERLDALLDSKDTEGLLNEVSSYFNEVFNVKGKTQFVQTKEFVQVFGDLRGECEYEAVSLSNIDVVFNNVIVTDVYNIIDYEWTFNFPVPIKYIMYRVIFTYIIGHSKRRILLEKGIYERFNITDEEITAFDNMEINFQRYVLKDSFSTKSFYHDIKPEKYYVVDQAYVAERDRGYYAVDVFFNKGEGILPESIVKHYDINKTDGTSLEIQVPEDVVEVRIDPASLSCIVEDLVVKDKNDNLLSPFSNGFDLGEGTIVFKDNDPNMYVTTKGIDFIKVSYRLRAISVETAEAMINSITELRNRGASLENALNESRNAVENLNSTIRERDAQLENTRECLEEVKASLDNTQRELQNKNEHINQINNQLIIKDNIIRQKEGQINEILNSTCWKITAPFRKVIGGTKSFLHYNPVTGSTYEFLFYVKRDGLKNALEMRKINAKAQREIVTNEAENASSAERIYIKDIAPLESFNKKIAVHLHLYYVDLLDEFINYFNNIPYSFDLYVSCKSGSDIRAITKKLKKLKHVNKVDVRETINRGRDIAPLYVQFGKEIEKYDYFMHVHSKKSLYSGAEQYGWRQFNLDCLVGNEGTVKKIFALFESDKRVGLFYPEAFGEMPFVAQDWLANAHNGRMLLNSLGIEFEEGFFNYPVGSFFWAKMDAVKPLFDRKFKYEDFPEEAGQTDGTIAHALERGISFVVKSRNYTDAIYDLKGGYISLGKSYKVYRDYFKTDYEAAQYHLSLFDVVSFDIFDTLITRAVYNPDDLFVLMGEIIKDKYSIKADFFKARKEAEAEAWNKHKEGTNIHHIYEELPKVLNISAEIAEEIKQLEIDLEINLCLPRRDMLKVFNHVKANGKRIILVSDMYLTSDIVGKMLEKCGFTGYEDLWISCEKGVRKDNDTIWKPFFDIYGQYNTIHVGDNPRSDIQTLMDKLKPTFFVMNPRTGFKMSKYYNSFKKYINGSIADSLMLGLMVNGGLFNSPFAQNLNGEPVIKNPEEFGFACFGPLLTAFCKWLRGVAGDEGQIMFLAREGYLFEKIYKALYGEGTEDKVQYFLTSRRAATVAAIRDENDIKEILCQYYRGSLSNMFKARLGIDLYDDMTDCSINMPEDNEEVMAMLSVHKADILQRAERERNAYKAYINKVGMTDKAILADVGYSGTIQYYLSKMTERKIKGAYLCTGVDRKPERIGCECLSMYGVLRTEDEKHHKIFRNQLFLEAVLKAPYGQLICFSPEGEPLYKSDNVISEDLSRLQQGVVDFARKFGEISEGIGILDKSQLSSDLVMDWFDTFLTSDWTDRDIFRLMFVQDDYCSNGNLQFDTESKSWVITQ